MNGNRIVQPYLFFNGSCEEAVEFYRKALGAEVEIMMRFKDSPEPHPTRVRFPCTLESSGHRDRL
jgi:PhnB protein